MSLPPTLLIGHGTPDLTTVVSTAGGDGAAVAGARWLRCCLSELTARRLAAMSRRRRRRRRSSH